MIITPKNYAKVRPRQLMCESLYCVIIATGYYIFIVHQMTNATKKRAESLQQLRFAHLCVMCIRDCKIQGQCASVVFYHQSLLFGSLLLFPYPRFVKDADLIVQVII